MYKSFVFLLISNEQLRFEMLKTKPFLTTPRLPRYNPNRTCAASVGWTLQNTERNFFYVLNEQLYHIYES